MVCLPIRFIPNPLLCHVATASPREATQRSSTRLDTLSRRAAEVKHDRPTATAWPVVVRSQPPVSVWTSSFHPGFQVGQDHLGLALVLLDDHALGQLAQHRDGHGVFDPSSHLRPSALGLERPRERALDAALCGWRDTLYNPLVTIPTMNTPEPTFRGGEDED